jgi:hypothetical protein
MIAIFSTACLLASVLIPANHFPWTMPGNFLQRMHISEVVVSGTIEFLSPAGVETVDGEELTATTARLRVDRVFQGEAAEELRFTWFALHTKRVGGWAYSGPPLAEFRPHKRYLVFLKRGKSGWVVAMPLYALELELSPTPQTGSIRNFSQLLPDFEPEVIDETDEGGCTIIVPARPPQNSRIVNSKGRA